MGSLRLMLSLLVVGSHVGGMGDTPAGATAIAGFFTISGFLMARTIVENYSGGRFPAFYLNRLLRLGPALAAALLLTAGAVWLRDGQGFQHLLENGAPAGSYMPVELPPSPGELITWNWRGLPLLIYPSVRILPQAWSLITESAFYMVAPLLVATFAPRWLLLRVGLPIASLLLAREAHGENWLRSPAAALWIFWLGMQAYFLAAQIPARAERGWAAFRHLAVLPAAAVVGIGCGLTPLTPGVIMFLVPVLIALWLVAGGWQARTGRGLDRTLGNLAYGVFLGHYLSTISMYWLAEAVYRTTGVFGVFGVPDVAEWRLRFFSFAFAVAFGVLIYYGFERPFERLRARIRARQKVLELATV